MIVLMLKLLIAHVLGDFVFQPNNWVKDKKEKTYKSKYFYFHGLVHLVSLVVLLQFNVDYWLAIIGIVLSHLVIDLFKLTFKHRLINERKLFVIDQGLHIAILGMVVYCYNPTTIDFGLIYSSKVLLMVLSLLTITYVASILMKIIMSKWEMKEDDSNASLHNAGQYIGILERLFIFGFILLNQWAAIGLLITAKSVFRFGDLSRAKDRKLTEYILIGTLLSFGISILVGVLYVQLIKMNIP